MGFYGNITNTARTQFQFDKTYPNRYEMEQKTKIDGIYAGRYILIEYDSNVKFDYMRRVWKKSDGYHTQDSIDPKTLLVDGDIEVGEIVYTVITSPDRVDPRDFKDCVFYRCSGFNDSDVAIFDEVVDGSESPAYTVNYNLDVKTFGAGRGYDSTVWQKTYTAEAGEKYVMIAELNTVVPTFAIAPDAPTMAPVVPHFDTQSTDVYYKLHWQAPWGFRLAGTDSNKSDEDTVWCRDTYDPATGITTRTYYDNGVWREATAEEKADSSKLPKRAAAIYFNEAAFDAQVDKSRTEATSINKHSNTVKVDEIRIDPTGKSGNKYNDHAGQSTQSEQVDIQEMTINLPAIGNMMSDAWDIIHGPRRNNDMRQIDPDTGDYVGSLQGRLDSIDAIENNQIPIKRADNGQMVGTKINGDTRDTITDNLDAELSTSYLKDDAWIETKVDADNTPNAIAIHHTFHATDSSVSSLDKNTGATTTSDEYKEDKLPVTLEVDGSVRANAVNADTGTNDIIKFYTPYVDAAGHVVGHNIEAVVLPYSYKSFNSVGASATNGMDIYTTITESADGNHTSTANPVNSETIADQTQDTMSINPYNKWIQVKLSDDHLFLAHEIHAVDMVPQATNLNTDNVASSNATDKLVLQDIAFDKAGHVIQNRLHTYTLPYGFKTIKTNGRSTEVSENATGTPTKTDVVAENTQDALTINSGNKWVRIDTDTANDTITIRHDVHNTSSTNSTTDWTKTEANTTIPTVTYVYDEAGHYVSHHTENYKLPFGYGKIKGDNSTSTAATATYDELTFASDEWLTATVAKDKVTYSHDYPKKVDDTTSTSNVNGNGDTIVLETLERDDKGHVIKVNQNTVTLPYGYKTFTGDSGTTSANNTQDTMAVTGDNWVQTTVSDDSIAFAHIGPVSGTATEISNETPDFGATFTIDDHYFDGKGHKFTSKSHTVKIPLPSLTNGTGNVVTKIALTDATKGAFTETRANVGTLAMTGYAKPTTLSNQALLATESLNTALGKLEYRLEKEVSDRTKSINDLDYSDTAVADNYVSEVSEVDGIISVKRVALPTLQTGTANGTVKLSNGANVNVYGLKSAAYTESSAYATAAQGTKADGAVQEAKKFKCGEEEKTVAELFELVASLQEELTQLKAKVEIEHPTPVEPETPESTE